MSKEDHYLHATCIREVPFSVLLENANKLKSASEEERQNLRECLAKEIEEKFPYKPGEDPNMPGIPIAEVSFTHPAYTNIHLVARRLNTKKDSRIKMFQLRAFLNIGDIQKRIDSKYRRCLAGRMSIGYCHDNEFGTEEYMKSNGYLDYYWSNLKSFLDEGKQLRIWYSDSPEEICGFYHLCTILMKYNQDFFAVELPETAIMKGKAKKVYSWNQMSEEAITEAAERTRILSKEEIKENAKVWNRLKKENSPLRAVINGQLVSVPEEFYDPWILNSIPADEPKKEEEVFFKFYDQLFTVGSGWLVHRIDEMIRQGEVELVEEHEHVWKQLIKRAK